MAQTDADRELMELQRSLSANGVGIAGLPSGAAVAADPEAVRTWELRRAAQREAYGQWVADGDIWIGNALTFTDGQPVPLEHVIRFRLDELEQVNRVATPELARAGRRFESNEEFLKANPHIARRLKARTLPGDLDAAALDPRGGGAAIDDARKAGKDTPEPTSPGDDTEARQAAVDKTAEALNHDDSDSDKGSKPRRGGRASGSRED